jgi:hypothetical protein
MFESFWIITRAALFQKMETMRFSAPQVYIGRNELWVDKMIEQGRGHVMLAT